MNKQINVLLTIHIVLPSVAQQSLVNFLYENSNFWTHKLFYFQSFLNSVFVLLNAFSDLFSSHDLFSFFFTFIFNQVDLFPLFFFIAHLNGT